MILRGELVRGLDEFSLLVDGFWALGFDVSVSSRIVKSLLIRIGVKSR